MDDRKFLSGKGLVAATMRLAGGINSHDVIALAGLMAADHSFVDSLGNRVHGASSMAAGEIAANERA